MRLSHQIAMQWGFFRRCRWRDLAALAFVLPTTALAQLRDDRFKFEVGWFLQSADAKVRVDGSSGNGTDIDLGDDLSLKKRDSSYLLGAEWRFAENHRLGVRSFNIRRTATATLEKDVTVGDFTFPAGSSATTRFESTTVPIVYSYSFMKDRNSEFAGTLGLHWTDLRLNVRANSNTNVASIDKESSAKVAAPLPLFGLRYDYAITPSWLLMLQGEVFYLKAGGSTTKYKGSLTNLRLATEYNLAKSVALGISYTYYALSADADSSDWKGRVKYTYDGPAIYLAAYF